MTKPGLLIAIEGIDASGKQSQTALLAAALTANTLSFPNYPTITGQLIQKLLRQRQFELTRGENALLLQSLMTVNRFEAWPSIERELQSNDVVLDRYFASGIAYGLYDGLDEDWLYTIHSTLFAPDLYVLLDIPVEESFRRRPNREDMYEADRIRLSSVRENYKRIWGQRPALAAYGGGTTAWVEIDGLQSEVAIRQQLLHIVEELRKSKWNNK